MAREPITISKYPIWEIQEEEEAYHYILFSRYYLPYAKPSSYQAYVRWQEDENEQKQLNSTEKDENKLVRNSRGSWGDHEKYNLWKERHRAYHLAKIQENQAYFEHQQREIVDKMLSAAIMAVEKSTQILNNETSYKTVERRYEDDRPMTASIIPADSKQFVDGITVLEKAKAILDGILGITDLNKAMMAVEKAGFTIIENQNAQIEDDTPAIQLLESDNQ